MSATILIFIYSFYNIFMIFQEDNKIKKIDNKIINDYTYQVVENNEQEEQSEHQLKNNFDNTKTAIDFKIKWDDLKSLNKDVIGWIKIPDTNINYPIVQGNSNQQYIKTNIYGDTSKAGCIFVDSNIINCFNCNNTIVYGHNLNNGAMFSDLKKYKNKEFANSHSYIYIILENNIEKKYRIFAFYEMDSNNSNIYNTNVENLDEYYKLISKYNTLNINYNLDTTKPILTLSTCTNYNEGRRFIVQAFCLD